MKRIVILTAIFLCANAVSVMAKQRFYTFRDVECGVNDVCLYRESKIPFSGELRTYDEDGKLLTMTEYKAGVRDGWHRLYYPDGRLKLRAVYKDGKENGVTQAYYDNNIRQYEKNVEHGVLQGESRSFYRDGTLKLEENFVNGKKDGLANGYYEDGSSRFRFVYNQGVLVSGYCVTTKGQRIELIENLSAYANGAKLPCDADDSDVLY